MEFRDHEENQCSYEIIDGYEPTRVYRWVLTIDGINAFLIKNVLLPVFSKSEQPRLSVDLHNVESISTNKDMLSWFNNEDVKCASLKFLDKLGGVTEEWNFNVKPYQMYFSMLDYGSSAFFTTHLLLDVSDVVIK